MNVLVTGAAGFIGHHLSKLLLKEGYEVIGIDNINDYYDPALKLARLQDMNINTDSIEYNVPLEGDITFVKLDLTDKDEIRNLFEQYGFDFVVNLAAQAGVRYSLINPHSLCGQQYYRVFEYIRGLQGLSSKTFGICFFKFCIWIKSEYSF